MHKNRQDFNKKVKILSNHSAFRWKSLPHCQSLYFTSTTRYLLVDQNSCGLVMRSVYCLLASRSN